MTSFQLLSPDNPIEAKGLLRELPRGAASTLADRVGAFFAQLEHGPRLLVGALPFDRDSDDYLFQPAIVESRQKSHRERVLAPPAQSDGCMARPEPSASYYAQAVSRALDAIAASAGEDRLRKVVLSRSLLLQTATAVDGDALLARLSADPSITAFRTPLPREGDLQPQLIGATPELLVSRKSDVVVSHPLAGSARRYADPAADRRSAEGLEKSDKNRREHNAVVEAVMDTLSPYCEDLSTPDGTTLRATATMWHLGTRIVGRLKDRRTPVAELAAALHPTPAVCGLPRQPAAALIRELEGYDRGFYAGAVGWSDAQGDGEWYVALRCARIAGKEARLYAGAGIVEGSDPLAEVDETSAKFLAMLDALGVDEGGALLRERAA